MGVGYLKREPGDSMLVFFLAACTPKDASSIAAKEEVDSEPPATCDDATACLFEGRNTFGAGRAARDVEVRLPAEPLGAPVVFVWHYLGGSPEEMLEWLGGEALADAGYVVIAPASRQLRSSEWEVLAEPEDNADVALFDVLLTAVHDQYATDAERVYATGFSAGGLFTSYLTMHRADVLAATAPFSGGVPASLYTSPSSPLPVMLTWGGEGDTYGGFDFAEATAEFGDALLTDGHEVVDCPHSSGHWLPANAADHALAFFDDHGGAGETPWSDAPDRVPTGCDLLTR